MHSQVMTWLSIFSVNLVRRRRKTREARSTRPRVGRILQSFLPRRPCLDTSHPSVLSRSCCAQDIAAPECMMPDVTFTLKWMLTQSIPLFAAIGCLIYYLFKYARSLAKGTPVELRPSPHTLIGSIILVFWFTHLPLTRAILEVFNCAPTNPPDGYTCVSCAVFGADVEARGPPIWACKYNSFPRPAAPQIHERRL